MIPKQEFVETEIGKIPEEWHKITLGELITFQRGHDLPLTKRKDGQYPIVASNGIIGCHDEFKAKGPGVTIGRSGNLGEPFFVKQDYWPHNTTLYSVKFHSSDPRFVYYFLKTLNLKGFNAGSAVPTLNRNHIHPIEVVVPKNINEQRAIASILGSLDDKIALNRSMNSTLEAIGQALFRRWFVDFEFPNEEGKPYRSSGGEMVKTELGEVPKGWRVGTLGDICEITMGQSPPGETYNEIGDGLPFYQGISDFGFRFPSRRVYCTAPTRFAEEGDVLLSVRAPVGTFNIADERCAIGRGVAALRLKGKHSGYLYYLLHATQTGWNKFEAEGTVFGSVTKSDVHDFKVILPSETLRNWFGSLVETLDKQITINEKQSRTLATIRDSLLPKLMSGEIRVSTNSNLNNKNK
ncbi:MAG: restriction endonuclease subunit S [Candidatus Methanoperedens sp.]